MYRVHEFEFCPILIGARKRYHIELPVNAVPRVFKTMTTDMRAWMGEVLDIVDGKAKAITFNKEVYCGEVVHKLFIGGPCVVMEKLGVDGKMGYMIGAYNIMVGNQNFVNFGIPNGKHIRIDIYNGNSEIIQ